jgi:hypothetical protein
LNAPWAGCAGAARCRRCACTTASWSPRTGYRRAGLHLAGFKSGNCAPAGLLAAHRRTCGYRPELGWIPYVALRHPARPTARPRRAAERNCGPVVPTVRGQLGFPTAPACSTAGWKSGDRKAQQQTKIKSLWRIAHRSGDADQPPLSPSPPADHRQAGGSYTMKRRGAGRETATRLPGWVGMRDRPRATGNRVRCQGFEGGPACTPFWGFGQSTANRVDDSNRR